MGAGRSSPGRSSGIPPPTSWSRMQTDAFGLNLWRFFSGVGLGLEMVTIGAYVSELAPKGLRGAPSRSTRRSASPAFPSISFLAFVLVPAAPLGVEGWRWVVLIGALAAPVVVVLRRNLPESPRWLAKHGRLAEADRGGAGDRGEGRGRLRQAAAAARPGRTDRPRQRIHGPLGPRRARAGDPDERLQHLPDDRLLRLLELGPVSARQAGDHRLDQPRLYDDHRARRAGRAAHRLLSRRPVRAQMDHRRARPS